MTGGFIATHPNAPNPSPASAAGGSGHTSVAGTSRFSSRLADASSGATAVGNATCGGGSAAASRARDLRLIAAAPRVDASARIPLQRVGTRAKSGAPISWIVG